MSFLEEKIESSLRVKGWRCYLLCIFTIFLFKDKNICICESMHFLKITVIQRNISCAFLKSEFSGLITWIKSVNSNNYKNKETTFLVLRKIVWVGFHFDLHIFSCRFVHWQLHTTYLCSCWQPTPFPLYLNVKFKSERFLIKGWRYRAMPNYDRVYQTGVSTILLRRICMRV